MLISSFGLVVQVRLQSDSRFWLSEHREMTNEGCISNGRANNKYYSVLCIRQGGVTDEYAYLRLEEKLVSVARDDGADRLFLVCHIQTK